MNSKSFVKEDVKKVYFKMAVPNIISMLFLAVCNLADGFFVGRYLGEQALASVNLIMPVVLIIFALADLIAVGSAVRVGIYLGNGQEQKAREVFTSNIIIAVSMGAAISILCAIGLKPVLISLFGGSLGSSVFAYAFPVLVALPLILPMFMLDNYLRACGKATFSLFVNVGVALLNLVLNWLFIAHLRLGIEFASLATAISYSVGTVVAIFPFVFKKIKLYFVKPKLTKKQFGQIVYNGSSEFFNSIAGSIVAIVANFFLLSYGGTVAVAAFGIIVYIETIVVALLFGAVDSMQPVISYNYGANQEKRILKFVKINFLVACIISLVVVFINLIFANSFVSIFIDSSNTAVIDLAVRGMFYYMPAYIFAWFSMVVSSLCTALNKAKQSLIIMVFRALVFPILTIVIGVLLFGVYGVFVSTAVASVLTLAITVPVLIKTIKYLKTKKIN